MLTSEEQKIVLDRAIELDCQDCLKAVSSTSDIAKKLVDNSKDERQKQLRLSRTKFANYCLSGLRQRFIEQFPKSIFSVKDVKKFFSRNQGLCVEDMKAGPGFEQFKNSTRTQNMFSESMRVKTLRMYLIERGVNNKRRREERQTSVGKDKSIQVERKRTKRMSEVRRLLIAGVAHEDIEDQTALKRVISQRK